MLWAGSEIRIIGTLVRGHTNDNGIYILRLNGCWVLTCVGRLPVPNNLIILVVSRGLFGVGHRILNKVPGKLLKLR